MLFFTVFLLWEPAFKWYFFILFSITLLVSMYIKKKNFEIIHLYKTWISLTPINDKTLHGILLLGQLLILVSSTNEVLQSVIFQQVFITEGKLIRCLCTSSHVSLPHRVAVHVVTCNYNFSASSFYNSSAFEKKMCYFDKNIRLYSACCII